MHTKTELVCIIYKDRDWAHTNWYAHKDRGLECIQAGIHYIKTETWAYTNWYAHRDRDIFKHAETHTHIIDTCPLLSYQLQPTPPPPPHPPQQNTHACASTHTCSTHPPIPPPTPTHTQRATDPDRRGSTGQAAWPGSHRLVHRTGSACIPPFLPETKTTTTYFYPKQVSILVLHLIFHCFSTFKCHFVAW